MPEPIIGGKSIQTKQAEKKIAKIFKAIFRMMRVLLELL